MGGVAAKMHQFATGQSAMARFDTHSPSGTAWHCSCVLHRMPCAMQPVPCISHIDRTHAAARPHVSGQKPSAPKTLRPAEMRPPM
eukprot:356122-Chlamydomonas_euryale.AAC.3